MEREIKFKVWDNVDYISSPFTLQDLMLKNIQFTSEYCKILQYTGLKDFEDKEIYEGDIVKDLNIDTHCEIVFTDYANFGLMPIGFKCAGLEYEIIDPSYTATTLLVVGNIYENPELLNSPAIGMVGGAQQAVQPGP